ncbi:MAG: branched-chain amino acid ABC transporter permease [Desulfomonile sp.]|jgi:branched-chain amino acid transport system permease protein|nr:branched-chain amino acid ABC transporter permease [Deltaproteobacteria bacterium]
MKLILVAVALAALVAAPWIVTDPFYVHLMIMVLMWTVLGASWNVVGGFAGQVSFGHSAFLGTGAYTTMILYLNMGIAPWYGIVLGGLVAAVIALPIGLICFRLRGPYFALSTLAVAEIIRLVALNWESLTNGPVGLLITTLPPVTLAGTALDWESKTPFYYIIAVLAVGALVATSLLARSRLGAYLLAVRDDIDSAEAIGINTVQVRVLALALSAFLAGVGGGFYAMYLRYIDPDAVFSIPLSVEMVFIPVVGGLTTVMGPFIGAVFLVSLGETFRTHFLTGHLIFYGLFMMVAIRYMPEGIWGRLRLMVANRWGVRNA